MSPAPSTSRSALVVGAGVGGLTAAIALAARGWDVRVEDVRDTVDSRGAALGLWPAAWRGLEDVHVTPGLGDAQPYRAATIRSVDGRVMGHLPLGRIEKAAGAPVRLVTRPALMGELVSRARAAGVDLALGTAFGGADRVAGHDVVIGADGINSDVRRHVAGVVHPRSLGAEVWRGSCDGTVAHSGEIWGRGMFAGVTPAGTGRTNWYVPVADSARVSTFADLQDRLAGWPPEIRDTVARTDPRALLRHPLQDLPPLPAYSRGRFVLVGDAAHAMAPSLGQGACQAVLDALALARLLDEDDVVPALVRYDRLQRPVGERLVRRSRRLLALQLSPRWAPVRDLALRLTRPVSPR